MSNLDPILKDFEADVERVKHLLSLVKIFKEFGASTPDEESSWGAAQSLHDTAKKCRTDLPIFSGSLQLYLAGRFEYCIRQVVETVAEEIASRTTKYTDIPDVIKNELKIKTLEIAQNPKRFGYDEAGSDALLEALVTSKKCIAGPVSIKSELLSLTDSNMKDRIMADLLKRVGMVDFWQGVGRQTAMKLEVEKNGDGETTIEAQARLNLIMVERNQVAHPTGGTQFPDPDKVLKAANFLKTLATITVDLAKVYLTSYRNTNGCSTKLNPSSPPTPPETSPVLGS